MTKDFFIINGLILLYILQRIGELFLSRNNEAWIKHYHHAVELNPRESFRMKLFHISWFVALIIESNYRHSFQAPLASVIVYLILGLCMLVRLHTIGQLKKFWSIKVYSLDKPVIATDGLYRYVRHPNYFIVICELLFVPFLFKAYFTMILFSLINLYVLFERIRSEERALMLHHDYKKHFLDKKRFIPFIFGLCFIFAPLYAKEIMVHSSSYKEAKKNENYLKFQSASTKFGLITTSFDGYALDFYTKYEEKDQVISKIDVSIPVKSMDTDVNSRDEKMHKEIMDAERFPFIKVSSSDPLKLNGEDQKINMIFTIKDRQILKPVFFTVAQKDGGWRVTGKTELSLSELGLPDPSIVIAKVRDQFDIEFEIVLKDK